jgi:hypothetical protein
MIIKKISVITPTIGRTSLLRNIQSVQSNAKKLLDCNIEHIIIIDGQDYFKNVMEQIQFSFIRLPNYSIVWFINSKTTGRSGAICRSYGTIVASGDYLVYLDDDNFFSEEHLKICKYYSEKYNVKWLYTARNIIYKNKKIIDFSESLGAYKNTSYAFLLHFVDTNCYFIERQLAQMNSLKWFISPIKENWGEDRVFYNTLAFIENKHIFVFNATVNYTTTKDIFYYIARGNKKNRQLNKYYGNIFKIRYSIIHYIKYKLYLYMNKSKLRIPFLWRFFAGIYD